MNKVKFLFGIHCHQPVGNFEHVLEDSYQKAYLPFIQTMERHPTIKFTVHYSGILYDWFLAKHPEFLDLLRKLVQRGQVEVMSAGYYEPVIPIVPDTDKIGQIKMSNQFIEENLGYTPSGMWLTERVWEPHLPQIIAQAGLQYVTVDDYHFLSAGIPADQLFGYYLTEEQGATLKVFPISKDLRYLIPFRMPEETINYLRKLSEKGDGVAAILADDGEKFGVWPGTHKWVYTDGYLEKLLTQFEQNSDWIEFVTFSQYLEEFPPVGRVYLPTASYFEMMEWSLPTASGKKLEAVVSELKQSGKFDEYSQFFKGGFFRNFLVKYPESNNLHKKMLYVSQKLEELKKKRAFAKLDPAAVKAAEINLYKGQCNCAYWHGVFGGLYLNYLRHAIYEHLIKAECALEELAGVKKEDVNLAILDFDRDGREEIIISNDKLSLGISPALGGAIFEMDYRPKAFNLLNTLARREEVYHQKLMGKGGMSIQEGVSSIHDCLTAKEAGLDKALIYDWHNRYALQDHFLAADTNLENYRMVKYREAGNFTIEPYTYKTSRSKNEVAVNLAREGKVAGAPIKVEKSIVLVATAAETAFNYAVSNQSADTVEVWFGVDFNFSMLAGSAPDRYYQIDGQNLPDRNLNSCGESDKISWVKLVDEWDGFEVLLSVDKPARLWRFPIETVSQSESGLEKNYQSSTVFPSWKIKLKPRETWKVKMTLAIKDRA
ncbi:MAG: alpha-amylase/4-alpha-glucanotransferase domain-containing protein [Candidatus Margulisiibacteriota bacterium]